MTAKGTQDVEVWKQVFQELMQEVKTWHQWTLEWDKDIRPDALEPGWMQYQQKAFARFHCSSCSRSWASALIQVLFHMRWDKKQRRGQVKMRVFSQRCNKCPWSQFEVPEFTLENISRILNNLVLRILKKCYKEGFRPMEEVSIIKEVDLEGPHDSSNCEACVQGFCAHRGSGLARQRPSSPDPYEEETAAPRGPAAGTHIPRSQPPLPQGGKVLPCTANPRAPSHPKVDPKVWQTSARQVLSTSTVNPQSNPPKMEPKVSHTSMPSTSLTTPIFIVNPEVPTSPKADLKPQCTSKSSTAPTWPTPLATYKSRENPPIFNPYKGSQTSKPSTQPTLHQPPRSSRHPALATHTASPKGLRAGDADWRSRPAYPQSSTASPCGPGETSIQMCEECGQCLCQSGGCLCKSLMSPPGLVIIVLVIVLVVLSQIGII